MNIGTREIDDYLVMQKGLEYLLDCCLDTYTFGTRPR